MKKFLLTLAFVLLLPNIGLGAQAVTATVDPGRLVVSDCIQKGWTCRPSLSLPIFDYSFNSGDFRAKIMPQGGYGIASPRGLFAADLFTGFIVGSGSTKNALDVSVIFSLFKYFSVGTAMEFANGSKPNFDLLIGGSLPLTLQ